MPAGRPSKYRPEMCDIVIDLMKQGASKTEVAAELDICWFTLTNWTNNNEEFSLAMKTGEKLSKAWWLRQAREHLFTEHQGKNLNASLWYMNMKNRFGWSDRTESIVKATISLTDLTEDELDRKIKELEIKLEQSVRD